MPLQTIQIPAGVNTERTPTLVAIANWSGSQLIRWKDGLPQKIGGWTQMSSQKVPGTARGMHCWADLMGNPYAAAGSEVGLTLLYGGALYDITPLRAVHNIAVDFSTISTTPTVTIKDIAHGAATGDRVVVYVPVSVGGLIIQGTYSITVLDADNYTITAAGNATTTVNHGGAVPSFTATNTSADVNVTFNNHGLTTGDNFEVQILTTVANLAMSGVYAVTVTNANVFVIDPGGVANATATNSENGGLAQLRYEVSSGFASATPLQGWGIGGWGLGPWGTSSGDAQVAPLRLWFLDNWGQDLVGNYTGSTIFTWSPPYLTGNVAIPIGSQNVAGIVVATAQSGAGSYKPGDTITLAGGTFTMPVTLLVQSTKVVSATIVAGGTGGTNGAQIVTGTTGTGTKFSANVTVAGNTITAVNSIAVPGAYEVNPTVLTAEPVTGASLTGAQLSVKMGVLALVQPTTAAYSALPANPVAQGSTSGTGTGATFTLTWTAAGISVPQTVNGSFVSAPQQIMIAYGCDPATGGQQDPNLVRWSDVADNTDWLATATNQAGSFRIPSGSKIIGMIQGPLFMCLWTDIDMWIVQYVGLPFVFTFNKIAVGADMLAPKAAGVYQSSVFWAGANNFFMYDGSNVRVIPCPVWDKFFSNLNREQKDKIFCAVNSWFGEVTWYYPSATGNGEVDSYVKLTVTENFAWDYGTLERTCWSDDNVFGAPIGIDELGLFEQHETSTDANGAPLISWILSGYFSLSDGDVFTSISRMIADFTFEGPTPRVFISFILQNYPSDPTYTVGPYAYQPSGPEFSIVQGRGRSCALYIESTDLGTFWRLGAVRFSGSPSGRR